MRRQRSEEADEVIVSKPVHQRFKNESRRRNQATNSRTDCLRQMQFFEHYSDPEPCPWIRSACVGLYHMGRGGSDGLCNAETGDTTRPGSEMMVLGVLHQRIQREHVKQISNTKSRIAHFSQKLHAPNSDFGISPSRVFLRLFVGLSASSPTAPTKRSFACLHPPI